MTVRSARKVSVTLPWNFRKSASSTASACAVCRARSCRSSSLHICASAQAAALRCLGRPSHPSKFDWVFEHNMTLEAVLLSVVGRAVAQGADMCSCHAELLKAVPWHAWCRRKDGGQAKGVQRTLCSPWNGRRFSS